jgi:hypothetical protein
MLPPSPKSIIGDVGPVEESVGMKLGWEFNLLVGFAVGHFG